MRLRDTRFRAGGRKPRPPFKTLPSAMRTAISRFAQEFQRQHRWLLIHDSKLKDRAAAYFRSQLPPWGKPGSHGLDDVTTAIGLRRKVRRHYAREYPNEKPPQIGKRVWKLICPMVIRDFNVLNAFRQREAREDLRLRVQDRLNKRRRSALRKKLPPKPPSI